MRGYEIDDTGVPKDIGDSETAGDLINEIGDALDFGPDAMAASDGYLTWLRHATEQGVRDRCREKADALST